MTLLEMTVVILVLMSLISVLFIGAQAWKRGSDRVLCIANIQNVQKGVRGFANLYGHDVNESVPGLQMRVIGPGRFIESVPNCPGGGSYSFGENFGPDTIPPVGELYMECSLAGSGHAPPASDDW